MYQNQPITASGSDRYVSEFGSPDYDQSNLASRDDRPERHWRHPAGSLDGTDQVSEASSVFASPFALPSDPYFASPVPSDYSRGVQNQGAVTGGSDPSGYSGNYQASTGPDAPYGSSPMPHGTNGHLAESSESGPPANDQRSQSEFRQETDMMEWCSANPASGGSYCTALTSGSTLITLGSPQKVEYNRIGDGLSVQPWQAHEKMPGPLFQSADSTREFLVSAGTWLDDLVDTRTQRADLPSDHGAKGSQQSHRRQRPVSHDGSHPKNPVDELATNTEEEVKKCLPQHTIRDPRYILLILVEFQRNRETMSPIGKNGYTT
ncbi:hypothetical protein IAT40_000837 [Kwoniella sp. CBS 6097]